VNGRAADIRGWLAADEPLTPLQRALIQLRTAHMTARIEPGTHKAFLEIEAILVAREIARRTDWREAA
jgi:hypothetical protein